MPCFHLKPTNNILRFLVLFFWLVFFKRPLYHYKCFFYGILRPPCKWPLLWLASLHVECVTVLFLFNLLFKHDWSICSQLRLKEGIQIWRHWTKTTGNQFCDLRVQSVEVHPWCVQEHHCAFPRFGCVTGNIDCPDGFDEVSCVDACSKPGKSLLYLQCKLSFIPKKMSSTDICNVVPGDFLCKDRRKCIDGNLVCDGSPHCFDRSDEMACYMAAINSKPTPLKCRMGSKPCKDGQECVLYSHVCDGEMDCKDGSDEHDCEYRCKEGKAHVINT